MGNKQGVEVRERSLRVVFTLDGTQRRQTVMVGGQPMRPTPANIRYAERLAAEIRDRISLGTFSMAEYFPASGTTASPVTVRDQLKTWLAAQRVEHSTMAAYSSAARFWEAAVGDKALRALKHSDLLLALAARRDMSGKTANNYVSVLRQALQLAVIDGLLQENPAEHIQRATWQREPPDPFSLEEAELIIADMRSHYPEQVANMVQWRFFSGVRTSEMAGLHWDAVDLNGGTFRVREAIVRGIEKSTTKTGVVRDVRLNSDSMAALNAQAKHTRLAGAHVWLDPRYGTPWLEERAFRRSYWTPTLKRLGIRYRAPNHMRHTFATMMLMAGRTPGWCAQQLGHSVEMFHRVYSKWISTSQDDRELAGFEAWRKAAKRGS